MSFLNYVKDKRFFITFFVMIMIFVSFIILFSDQHSAWAMIIYTNISCFLFAGFYLVSGYLYRRKFYHELSELVHSGQEELPALIPEPQNVQQSLYLDLIKKVYDDHTHQLQSFYDEKRDQQEFIMSWIHEVKLPISASRLLMENNANLTKEYLADKLEDELDKIDHYVEQALYYSRIDSFSKDYFIKEIQVNQIIKNSVKKYSKMFIKKGVHFEMENKEQLVQSDSKWLGFVVDQIIANALKYTHQGGKILVTFEENSKEKRVMICDNGVGIRPEDINRVFEKGFTGSIGRSHAKSTGMGLYLGKQLAIKLGHDITVDSEVNEYTQITIHFPKNRNYYLDFP